MTTLDGEGVGHGALRGKPGPVYARLYEAYQRAKHDAVDLKPAPARGLNPRRPPAHGAMDTARMQDIPAEQSLIEYPSRFPIKVMGTQRRRLRACRHRDRAPLRPGFDAATIELRPSSGGKYLGVTITVNATSREQLDELYRTLSTHPMVKVVL